MESEQDAVLSQGGPRDTAVNSDTCIEVYSSRAVFTAMATLSN